MAGKKGSRYSTVPFSETNPAPAHDGLGRLGGIKPEQRKRKSNATKVQKVVDGTFSVDDRFEKKTNEMTSVSEGRTISLTSLLGSPGSPWDNKNNRVIGRLSRADCITFLVVHSSYHFKK